MKPVHMALMALVALVALAAGFALRSATDDDGESTSAVSTQVVTTVVTTTVAATGAETPPTPTEGPATTGSPAPAPTAWPGLEFTTAILSEEEETYSIDAEYPRFGLAIDRRIKDTVDTAAAEIRTLAKDQPPGTFGSPGPYTLDAEIASVYVSPSIVSVRMHVYTYTGGAHGNGLIYSFNTDPSDGIELTLDDALSMIDLSLPEVADAASRELQQKLGGSFFSEGALPDPKNYETFVVGPDQVTFVFQSYQVGPYAAGPQEVSFPRSDVSSQSPAR